MQVFVCTWWAEVADRCDLSTLYDDLDGMVLTVSLLSPDLHSMDGVSDEGDDLHNRDGVSDKGDYSSLVSVCSVIPEELVPSKGEAMSVCQVVFLTADDVHSFSFEELL